MWWAWPKSAPKWNKLMCVFNFFKEIFFSLDFSLLVIFGTWFPRRKRVSEKKSCEDWAHTQFGPTLTLAPSILWSEANFGLRNTWAPIILWPDVNFGPVILWPKTTLALYSSAQGPIFQKCHFLSFCGFFRLRGCLRVKLKP